MTGSTGTCNLSLNLNDSTGDVDPSQTFTYSVVLTNLNAATASNVTATLSLDNDVSLVSVSDGGTGNNSLVTWNGLVIPGNGSKTVSAVVRVNANVGSSDVLTASAQACNGSDSESTDVGGTADRNISLEIDDSPDPVNAGDRLRYSLRLHNNSSSSQRVDVTAYLDEDTRYRSSTEGGRSRGTSTVEWENIDVGANGERTLEMTVDVAVNARDGDTLYMRARTDGDDDSETTRVRNGSIIPPIIPPIVPPVPGVQNLMIDKVADRNEVQPGSLVAYTVTVRNSTAQMINSLTLTDTFPAELLSIQEAAGGSASASQITWTIPELAPNTSRVVSYRARVSPSARHGQTIANAATVTAGSISVTDRHNVHVISLLPQTWIASFIKASAEAAKILSPSRTKGPDADVPFTLWLSIVVGGLTAGSVFARKLLSGF